MKVDQRGCTRVVLLLGSVAVKLPRLSSAKMFLHGCLANLEEGIWNRKNLPQEAGLPEVLFVAPLGLLAVQRRVKPVKHTGLFWIELERLLVTSSIDAGWWLSDAKPANFGYLNGQLVKVDVA